jgi:anti-sigma B factor antagonist
MRTGPEFRVDVGRDGAAVVVAPVGELDLATVVPLREVLDRFEGCAAVVLDLRGVSFIDSAGLSLVMEQQRRAEREGVEFRLVRGPRAVQRLFELTGVSRHLVWVDEVAPTATGGGSDRG